ncbi:MAG: asparagine synthase (glutamine-hydrolyzing) [Helicobacteraceae bacterium]|jgi:asparagine synthase (glutamine-hydrolysing)|nr:asparagine synthase (glutamine-hydrolyzing) [Helicobacteraceae bacterium]
MCGIAGFVGASDPKRAAALLKALAHRGPDDQGTLECSHLTLVHRRLSILDLANGHQPMERGHFAIVFNGEIYNHQALRKTLKTEFKTRSDTETLLALYEARGKDMLPMLDGMFAFAIFDAKEHTLLLGRDRYGKKPLYYSFKNGFMFASEINALKAIGRFDMKEESIEAFLRFGFIPFEHTAYEDMYELNAASYMRVNLADMSVDHGRYVDFTALSQTRNMNENEALEATKEALQQAIKDRIESSDVEVGAFLSGGIDSSLISSYAIKHKADLKTFTVSFSGAFDESTEAEQTARQIGSNHQTIRIEANLQEDIDQILSAYGEPFADSSCVPSWYVAKAARKVVKVVLNGDGADELFGGYRRYVPLRHHLFSIAAPFSPLTKLLPSPNDKMSGYNYLYRLLESSAQKTPLLFWLKTRVNILTDRPRGNAIFDQALDMLNDLKGCCSSLQTALAADRALLLAGDLLVKMDIATMAHSLEGRSPFLSRELSLLAPSLSDRLKVRGLQTKYILRSLARQELGDRVANAPKRGFEVPLRSWVEGELKEIIFDRVLSPRALWRGFEGSEEAMEIINGSGGMERRARVLWTLFALETWHENDRVSKPL